MLVEFLLLPKTWVRRLDHGCHFLMFENTQTLVVCRQDNFCEPKCLRIIIVLCSFDYDLVRRRRRRRLCAGRPVSLSICLSHIARGHSQIRGWDFFEKLASVCFAVLGKTL